MQIYYETTVFEKVEEVQTIGYGKLLSEVGSMLALLLGFSVLNLFEVFEIVLRVLGRCMIMATKQ